MSRSPAPNRSESEGETLSESEGETTLDPLGPAFNFGVHQSRLGFVIGLVGTIFIHGTAMGASSASLFDLASFASFVQKDIEADLRATYDINVEPEKKEPAPPPPEPVEEEKEEPAPKQAKEPEPQAPPPAAAQAGQALTAEPDPDEPLDLTGNAFTIVSGDGERFAGGVTERGGTERVAVRDRDARAAGRGRSPGAGPVSKPVKVEKPKKDRSRPAMPTGSNWNSCGFPAEADMAQIDYARVSLVVTVNADGRAQSVVLQGENPGGYGFGALAVRCARQRRFQAGRDADGNPITTTTPPFWVAFTR